MAKRTKTSKRLRKKIRELNRAMEALAKGRKS